LDAITEFVLGVDRLKHVERRSYLADGSRRENSAEHSWHLALMAIVLSGHVVADIDTDRVIRMLLVHDLVEIVAGDTFRHAVDYDERTVAELRSLPEVLRPLGQALREAIGDLCEEFESGISTEARFGQAIDALQPLLLNAAASGKTWKENGVTESAVRDVSAVLGTHFPELGSVAIKVIERASSDGLFAPEPPQATVAHPPAPSPHEVD
jgi:putative hydrolase of HD superfamily